MFDVDSAGGGSSDPSEAASTGSGDCDSEAGSSAGGVQYSTMALGCGGWGTVIVTASARMAVTPTARGPGRWGQVCEGPDADPIPGTRMAIGVAPDGALPTCTDNVCCGFVAWTMKYTSYEGIGLSVGTYRWTFHCSMAKQRLCPSNARRWFCQFLRR